jgi:hypothetical protein
LSRLPWRIFLMFRISVQFSLASAFGFDDMVFFPASAAARLLLLTMAIQRN